MRQILIDRNERRVIEIAATGHRQCFEELLHQCSHRQGDAGRLAGVHGDVEILAMQVDPEPGGKFAADRILALELHHAAIGQAATEHLEKAARLGALHPFYAMLLAQFGFLTLLNFADLTFPMLLVHLLCFDPAWLRRAEVSDPGVLLFDGDCAFCHASVRLALHEDRHWRLRFAPLQGASAKRLLNGRVIPDDGDSIVLVDEHGQIARKSAAVIGVLMRLGGLWLLPAWLLRSLPRRLADAGYDLVGRWRYRLAGKVSGSCPWRPEYNGRVLP